jgi:hypothetical protein
LRRGDLPRLPQDLTALSENRLFAAPAEICVSTEQIKAAQMEICLQAQ